MKICTLLTGVFLSLSLPALAEQAFDLFLTGWQQKVGQQVPLSECYLNTATTSQMYRDARNRGTSLYIDTKSFDSGAMQQARGNCGGYNMETQCRVILNGTLAASFGSPLLVNGQAAFLAGDTNAQSED